MAISLFDSNLFSAAAVDAQTAELCGDAAALASMLRVEAALATAQGELGIIPRAAAQIIANTAATIHLTPYLWRDAIARDGVPVPALVAALRAALPADVAVYVHWGVTSQDIIDTALVLRLQRIIELQREQLKAAMALLAELASQHRATPIAARTRFQIATPTTFGLKVAGWLAPLLRQWQRLQQLTPRLLVLQLGGAVGNLALFGARGDELTQTLARALQLNTPLIPWHNQRDNLVEYTNWLAMTSGCLGKIGGDLLLLAQSEIGEVHWANGGASSTMPHKANPVAAEMLAMLAQRNAQQIGAMQQALLHTHERDGSRWTLEWFALPDMLATTSAALNGACACLRTLRIDAPRMFANLDATRGAVLAEAILFELMLFMPRAQAQQLVNDALAKSTDEKTNLLDEIAAACRAANIAAPIDWQDFKHNYLRHCGSVARMIDAVLSEWQTLWNL
jgi:3-carboxy-cis,cis-muconate cycloisomerase